MDVVSYPRHLVLEDIHVHVDRSLSSPLSYLEQISFIGAMSVRGRRWRFTPMAGAADLVLANGDSVDVVDVVARGHRFMDNGIAISGLVDLRIDSLTMEDCLVEEGGNSITSQILSISGGPDTEANVSNIKLIGCRNEKTYEHGMTSTNHGIFSITSCNFDCSDIEIRNCYCATYTIAFFVSNTFGVARRIVMEDNVCGSDPGAVENDCEYNCNGHMIMSYACSFEDLVMRRNTSHLYPMIYNGQPMEQIHADGLQLYATTSGIRDQEHNFFRRLIFEDNLVIDYDDYTNPDVKRDPNLGRAFYLDLRSVSYRNQAVIEDCLFRRNRQYNSVPESPSGDPVWDGRQVGSTMELYADRLSENWRGKLWLRNILMDDNDDGGVYVDWPVLLDARNVMVRNCGRSGIHCYADTLNMRNIWVERTQSRAAHYTYPYGEYHPSYQAALTLRGHLLTGDVSNITLINNNTEFLFWANSINRPPVNVQNALIWGNNCDYFTNPWWNAAEFPPPAFAYSLLDEFQPGESNLIGIDPRFDPVLGPPFLAPNSPCIDAGNPAATYNDREDPANPGFALWPSLGGLRNDIGFTGGAAAAAPDTGWVSLPRPYEPRKRPQDFSLGAPWPNPYNPTTRIPITLTRPEIVKLSVHNLLGQEVAVLVHGLKFAGRHEIEWNAAGLASGIYLITLEVVGQQRQETRAVTLLR